MHLNLFFSNFLSWPLVWYFDLFNGSKCLLPDLLSFSILKTVIISPLSLLYFRVGNFNFFNLSSYERCFKFGTNLVALLSSSSSGVLVFSPGDYFTNDRVTPVKLTWPRNVNVSVVELTDGTKNNFVHLKRLKMLKVKRGMCLPCFKTNIHDLCAWWKNEILYWHYMMV